MRHLIFTLFLMFSLALSAQNHNGHFSKNEFRNKQKEFFIKRAELTPDEAMKFFPLYFEFQDKKAEYNSELWRNIRKVNKKNITDTEYSKISEDIVKTKITLDNLELEYLDKYKKVLSPKKIFNIQKAEMRFHREMIKNMKEEERRNKEKK